MNQQPLPNVVPPPQVCPPHRSRRATLSSEGGEGVLVAPERMKYWELNKPDGVKALAKLKLGGAGGEDDVD